MQAIIINRKTNATDKFKFTKNSLHKIKNIAGSVAAAGSKYFITVIAESEKEIDIISNNFHNIPVPATPATRAVWTGDLAVFILLNYPADIPNEQ